MFRCGVCEAQEAEEVVHFGGYPACLVPLPIEVARTVKRVPLTLAACRACGHLQVADVDALTQDLIYRVYYTYYQVDGMETMLPVYRQPFNELVQSLVSDGRLPHGRLLEIGCSSGAMVPFLTPISTSYTGIDPSERVEQARAAYPAARFVRDFFPSPQLEAPFDVIVTQFNLEHIEHIGEYLDAVRTLATDGSMLLVQVPDAGYYVRTHQPNFLAHEHVHYFRKAQLERLLRRHGFTPIAWGEEGASLICASVAGPRAEPSPERNPLRDLEELRGRFSAPPQLPANAILYGVGLTLHWLLLVSPELGEGATVVDDNDGYAGFGVPGHDLRIVKPDVSLFQSGRDIILTLNEIYHERVLSRLRAMGTTGRIHRIREGAWATETL